MTEEKEIKCNCNCKHNNFGGGGIYLFGLFGSLFYFLPQATSANAVIFAIFKSIFWPAVFVFHILQLWKL